MPVTPARDPTTAAPATGLWVGRWPDPIVESTGVDTRSPYVERFWLPVLGPSATLLLRALADDLDRHPGGYRLDLAEAAAGLGVSPALGPRAPLARALTRLGRFGVLRPVPGGILLRARLTLLPRRQLLRLAPGRRVEHDRWMAAHRPGGGGTPPWPAGPSAPSSVAS